MSKTNSHTSRSALNHREAATRNKQRQNYRENFIRNNSSAGLKQASITLSVCKQKNKYFLDYIEIWLGSSQKNLTALQKESLNYNRYHEALNALLHNIYFILNIQNFGTTNKFGNVIDIDYMKSLNFEYDAMVRSLSGCKTKSTTIKNEEQLNNALVYVLKTSMDIVNQFKQNVDIVKLLTEAKDAAPKYEERIGKDNISEVKLFDLAKNLINDLQNNEIDTVVFSRAIAFENKTTSFSSP